MGQNGRCAVGSDQTAWAGADLPKRPYRPQPDLAPVDLVFLKRSIKLSCGASRGGHEVVYVERHTELDPL